jgi:hypothetical protein
MPSEDIIYDILSEPEPKSDPDRHLNDGHKMETYNADLIISRDGHTKKVTIFKNRYGGKGEVSKEQLINVCANLLTQYRPGKTEINLFENGYQLKLEEAIFEVITKLDKEMSNGNK